MASGLPGIPVRPYKSRRGWLIGFGVAELLIASVFLLAIGLLAFLPFPATPPQPSPPSAALPVNARLLGAVTYGFLAAIFITIGIGSIRCRNWARITALVVSALWLGAGLLATAVNLWLVPRVMQRQGMPPDATGHVFILMMAAVTGFFMVLLPAVFLLFYSRRSVKVTCESGRLRSGSAATAATQPFLPLPVPLIILAVWEALGVFSLFGLLFARVTVVFGVVVHGSAAFLVLLLYAVLSGCAAWLILRRRLAGWGIALISSLFLAVSTLAGLAGHKTLMQIGQEMGLSRPALRIYQEFPGMARMIWGWSLAFTVALVIFVLYTKRFFQKPQGDSVPLTG